MVAEAAESTDAVAMKSADAEEEIEMDSCHGARPYRHQVVNYELVNYESAETMVVLAPSLET